MKKNKDQGFDANPLAMGSGIIPRSDDEPSIADVEAALNAGEEAGEANQHIPAAGPEVGQTANQGLPGGIDPMAVMDRLARAMEALSAQTNRTDKMETMLEVLSKAMERVADATIQGANIQATEAKRAHRPSNEIVHLRSVFNRRGVLLPDYKKPPLKCVMLLPFIAEWESLTREEVELLNLLEAGSYLVKRVDNSKIRVNVIVDLALDHKTPSRLVVQHDTAFNNDNFNLFPSITEWTRQILNQHENPAIKKAARAVLSDEEEEAMIEAGELTVSV